MTSSFRLTALRGYINGQWFLLNMTCWERGILLFLYFELLSISFNWTCELDLVEKEYSWVWETLLVITWEVIQLNGGFNDTRMSWLSAESPHLVVIITLIQWIHIRDKLVIHAQTGQLKRRIALKYLCVFHLMRTHRWVFNHLKMFDFVSKISSFVEDALAWCFFPWKVCKKEKKSIDCFFSSVVISSQDLWNFGIYSDKYACTCRSVDFRSVFAAKTSSSV